MSELDLPAHGNVSEEEIKRAYRKKATEYHPDKLQAVPLHIRALAEAKMVAINLAYQGLTDSGAPSRDYYFNHPISQTTFTPSVADEVLCACWTCEQTNRIQSDQSKSVARCGNCHAFLGLESDPKKKSS